MMTIPILSLIPDVILDDNTPISEEPPKIVDENKDNIFFILSLVSISCNIFTLLLSFVMI